jgi:hypothetical protein
VGVEVAEVLVGVGVGVGVVDVSVGVGVVPPQQSITT